MGVRITTVMRQNAMKRKIAHTIIIDFGSWVQEYFLSDNDWEIIEDYIHESKPIEMNYMLSITAYKYLEKSKNEEGLKDYDFVYWLQEASITIGVCSYVE